jgi:O-antigen/teichoic acid export membrane protein
MTGAFLPVISGWEATDEHERIRGTYQDSSRYLTLATFFIALFFLGSSRAVFHLWLHHHYSGEYIALALLTATVLTNSFTAVGTTILRGIGKPRKETFYAVASAVIKIAISLSLAAQFKLTGILMGTVVGTAIGSLYFLWLIFHYLRLSWKEGLWSWITPIMLPAVVSGSVVFVISGLTPLPPGRLASFGVVSLLGVLYAVLFVLGLRLSGFYRRADYERLARALPPRWLLWLQRLRILPIFSPKS